MKLNLLVQLVSSVNVVLSMVWIGRLTSTSVTLSFTLPSTISDLSKCQVTLLPTSMTSSTSSSNLKQIVTQTEPIRILSTSTGLAKIVINGLSAGTIYQQVNLECSQPLVTLLLAGPLTTPSGDLTPTSTSVSPYTTVNLQFALTGNALYPNDPSAAQSFFHRLVEQFGLSSLDLVLLSGGLAKRTADPTSAVGANLEKRWISVFDEDGSALTAAGSGNNQLWPGLKALASRIPILFTLDGNGDYEPVSTQQLQGTNYGGKADVIAAYDRVVPHYDLGSATSYPTTTTIAPSLANVLATSPSCLYQAFSLKSVRFILLDTSTQFNPKANTMLGTNQLSLLLAELDNASKWSLVFIVMGGISWSGRNSQWSLCCSGERRTIANKIRSVPANNVMILAGSQILALDNGDGSDYADGAGGAGIPNMNFGSFGNYDQDYSAFYSEGCNGFQKTLNFQFATVNVTIAQTPLTRDICVQWSGYAISQASKPGSTPNPDFSPLIRFQTCRSMTISNPSTTSSSPPHLNFNVSIIRTGLLKGLSPDQNGDRNVAPNCSPLSYPVPVLTAIVFSTSAAGVAILLGAGYFVYRRRKERRNLRINLALQGTYPQEESANSFGELPNWYWEDPNESNATNTNNNKGKLNFPLSLDGIIEKFRKKDSSPKPIPKNNQHEKININNNNNNTGIENNTLDHSASLRRNKDNMSKSESNKDLLTSMGGTGTTASSESSSRRPSLRKMQKAAIRDRQQPF